MQLAEWSLHTYALRYEKPIRWSDIVEEAAPFVLLRLQDETGAVGVAEVTVKPTWCGVTARSLIAAVEDIFLPIVTAVDLADPSAIRLAVDRVPENLAAKTLVDNACWDLYAARTGRSLGDLWGGVRRVDVSWALTRQSPRDMAAEAAAVVARYGFKTIKIKGGQGIDVDRAVMHDVRAVIGAGVQLYVDANGAYPYASAGEYARIMADFGALMVEDPCVTSPDARLRQLQEESPVPILVDFGCTSVRDAALYIENGARALSVKPGRFGFSAARAMQQLAVQANCSPIVGLMGESTVGTFAGLQFASAVDRPALPAELSGYLAMTEHVTTIVPKVIDGAIELPDVASTAALIDWDAVAHFGP
jgi:L-alanine-DL-glutamate epimerase-like enolase superfamily enzyme